MNLRSKIRTVRAATGLSQIDFSELINVPESTYRDIERGRARLPMHAIERLAVLYGIDAGRFADEDDDYCVPAQGIPRAAHIRRERLLSETRKRTRRKSSNGAASAMPSGRLSERCMSCWFRLIEADRLIGCGYYMITGARRGCPLGDDCTRYVEGNRPRHYPALPPEKRRTYEHMD